MDFFEGSEARFTHLQIRAEAIPTANQPFMQMDINLDGSKNHIQMFLRMGGI